MDTQTEAADTYAIYVRWNREDKPERHTFANEVDANWQWDYWRGQKPISLAMFRIVTEKEETLAARYAAVFGEDWESWIKTWWRD